MCISGIRISRELQEQPYIPIAQRKPLEEVRRQIRRVYGNTAKARQYMEQVRADQDVAYMAGNSYAGGGEENGGGKTTVLTRLWKEWDEAGESYTIRGIQVCGGTGGDGGVVVRPAWDLGIRLYPLAKFDWDRRQNCAYGDSEIPLPDPQPDRDQPDADRLGMGGDDDGDADHGG